jgi:acetoacetate decarboxylase
MTIPLDQIANMPACSSYYPMPPARYRNVRFQYVCFRADVAAIDRVLPACFEPATDGFCAAFGLSAEWTANYGKFEESGLLVRCNYNGQTGYFAPVVFLNSRSSISAGREIYGTPKVHANMQVEMDERVMYTDTRLAGTSVLSVRSTMHRSAAIDEMPVFQPSWRLKVIPRADGQGADVMQIIDTSNVTTDVTIHACHAGDGVVAFSSVPTYDLSDFTPREYFGAHYIEMEYTEGYAEIVEDLLQRKTKV